MQKLGEERKLKLVPQFAIPSVDQQRRWLFAPVLARTVQLAVNGIVFGPGGAHARGELELMSAMKLWRGAGFDTGREEVFPRQHCFRFINPARWNASGPHAATCRANRPSVQCIRYE